MADHSNDVGAHGYGLPVAGAIDLSQLQQPTCARCGEQPPPQIETPFAVARDGRMVCFNCVAEAALAVPHQPITPTGISKEGFVLQCRKCDAQQLLPNVGNGHISIREAGGWYITSETGALCPLCAPARDGDSPGISEGES